MAVNHRVGGSSPSWGAMTSRPRTWVSLQVNRGPGAIPRGFVLFGQLLRVFASTPSLTLLSTDIARDHERRRCRPTFARGPSLEGDSGRDHQRPVNGERAWLTAEAGFLLTRRSHPGSDPRCPVTGGQVDRWRAASHGNISNQDRPFS